MSDMEFLGANIFYDEIEYYYENEGADIREFIDTQKGKTLNELIKLYHEIPQRLEGDHRPADQAANEDAEAIRKELEIVRIWIARELGLPTQNQVHYLVDKLEEFRGYVEDALQDTNVLAHRFANHRHNKEANYSEKPVY